MKARHFGNPIQGVWEDAAVLPVPDDHQRLFCLRVQLTQYNLVQIKERSLTRISSRRYAIAIGTSSSSANLRWHLGMSRNCRVWRCEKLNRFQSGPTPCFPSRFQRTDFSDSFLFPHGNRFCFAFSFCSSHQQNVRCRFQDTIQTSPNQSLNYVHCPGEALTLTFTAHTRNHERKLLAHAPTHWLFKASNKSERWMPDPASVHTRSERASPNKNPSSSSGVIVGATPKPSH
jgi:hypothetical protein